MIDLCRIKLCCEGCGDVVRLLGILWWNELYVDFDWYGIGFFFIFMFFKGGILVKFS